MKLSGYQIEQELGRGGMATVYLAMQDSLNRPVALKIMNEALASDEAYTARFIKEGRFIAGLGHPNIITIFDVGTIESRPYIAMEYIAGGTLEDHIDVGLAPERVITIIRSVAKALVHAHSRGIIHRDVKPANILFHTSGEAILTDFGVAKGTDGAAAMTSATTIGTPNYMSPEQIRGQKVDARTDQYGLGAMLYECLTGTTPYTADNPFAIACKHIYDPIPTLLGDAAVFQPLLNRLMAKDPEQRYNDEKTFLADLNIIEQEYRQHYGKGKRVVALADRKQPRSLSETFGVTKLSGSISGLWEKYGWRRG